MPAFQIETPTEVHVSSVTNRQETHGEEKVPAVSIGFELTTANTVLDQIDPTLRHALYKAIDGQDQLPGIEPATPVLRCNSVERVTLPTKHEGWTVQVDDSFDESDPMTFGECKVDKFSIEPKQGGSIVLRFRVGTSDIDAERLGKMGMHNGQSLWITVRAPKVKPDAIDGTTGAFQKDHPGAADGQADLLDEQGGNEAGDAFAHGKHPDDNDEGDDDTDIEGGTTDANGQNWPFPKGDGPGLPGETEASSANSTAPAPEAPTPPKPARRGRSSRATASIE